MSIKSNARFFKNGPAPEYHKIMRTELMEKMGMTEAKLPLALRDTIVKRTKRGPIGALAIRNMSGMVHSPALKIVRTFEKNVGGKEEVAAKLEAVRDQLTPEQLKLLVLLKAPSKKALARLMLDAGAEPVGVMSAFAKGCVVLGKIEAAIEAHKNLPGLIKDLYRHALDQEEVCKICVGLKEVPQRSNAPGGIKVPCPGCDGSGVSLRSSKHKEFAHRQLLEVTKLVERGPAVQVNQQVAISGGRQMGYFEKMLDTADNISFPEQKERIIDAEVVVAEAQGEDV